MVVTLWHGAKRWTGPPQILPAKTHKDVEYGPGFYLTTSPEVARKYTKGGGRLLRFEVETPLVWIDSVRIPVEDIIHFVREVPRLKQRKLLMQDVVDAGLRAEQAGRSGIVAAVLGNLMNYYATDHGQPGIELVRFYLDHGIDAARVTGKGLAGQDEYVVLYDLAKIKGWTIT